jgi:sulfate adenylyltransferase subunit 1 (EFTu-like GTPase family)
MDLVAYSEDVFRQIRAEFEPFLHRVGAKDPYFLPLSALKGDNVVDPSRNMGWFRGPSLLEHLETVETQNRAIEAPFRMAVQRVVRPNQDFRGYAGQIASGVIRPGDEVIALSSGRRTRVRSIATFDGDLKMAHAPLSVTLTLEDEIDISRGDMIAGGDAPLAARTLEATIVWFDGKPLDPSRDYLVKQTSHVVPARVEAVKHKMNVSTLEIAPAADGLWMNEIGVVRIAGARPLFFDKYAANRGTGSFILIDRETNATAGAGMILSAVEDIVENAADRVARLVRALVPASAPVDLPEDDATATKILRGRLKGLWND